MSTNLLGVKLGQRWCLNHTTANSDAQSDVFLLVLKSTPLVFILSLILLMSKKISLQ